MIATVEPNKSKLIINQPDYTSHPTCYGTDGKIYVKAFAASPNGLNYVRVKSTAGWNELTYCGENCYEGRVEKGTTITVEASSVEGTKQDVITTDIVGPCDSLPITLLASAFLKMLMK